MRDNLHVRFGEGEVGRSLSPTSLLYRLGNYVRYPSRDREGAVRIVTENALSSVAIYIINLYS